MKTWLLPGIGVAAVGGAAVVAAVVFSSGSGSAQCDTQALATAMRSGLAAAEQRGMAQMTIEMPPNCGDGDMMRMMASVSRSWHAMDGGVMMRQSRHTGR